MFYTMHIQLKLKNYCKPSNKLIIDGSHTIALDFTDFKRKCKSCQQTVLGYLQMVTLVHTCTHRLRELSRKKKYEGIQ